MRLLSTLMAIAGATMILLHTLPAAAQTGASASAVSANTAAAEHCAAVLQGDFSKLIDAPTQVEDAKVIDASSDGPAYCQVLGYVSPNVGFKLFLPINNWNGKFSRGGLRRVLRHDGVGILVPARQRLCLHKHRCRA